MQKIQNIIYTFQEIVGALYSSPEGKKTIRNQFLHHLHIEHFPRKTSKYLHLVCPVALELEKGWKVAIVTTLNKQTLLPATQNNTKHCKLLIRFSSSALALSSSAMDHRSISTRAVAVLLHEFIKNLNKCALFRVVRGKQMADNLPPDGPSLDIDAMIDEVIARKGPHKYTEGFHEDRWEEVSRHTCCFACSARCCMRNLCVIYLLFHSNCLCET